VQTYFVQVLAEEVSDTRVVTMSLNAQKLDKKVTSNFLSISVW